MDCDGSLEPRDLPRVAEPVASGRADLVLGARDAAPGAWAWHARTANTLLARRVRARTGCAVSDLGPMRAARRTELVGLGLQDRRFGYPLEMLLRAAAAGWTVHEVRVPYAPRVGRSKVTGTIRGSVRALQDMATIWRAVDAAAPEPSRAVR